VRLHELQRIRNQNFIASLYKGRKKRKSYAHFSQFLFSQIISSLLLTKRFFILHFVKRISGCKIKFEISTRFLGIGLKKIFILLIKFIFTHFYFKRLQVKARTRFCCDLSMMRGMEKFTKFWKFSKIPRKVFSNITSTNFQHK
jgi:hypothetical protein